MIVKTYQNPKDSTYLQVCAECTHKKPEDFWVEPLPSWQWHEGSCHYCSPKKELQMFSKLETSCKVGTMGTHSIGICDAYDSTKRAEWFNYQRTTQEIKDGIIRRWGDPSKIQINGQPFNEFFDSFFG